MKKYARIENKVAVEVFVVPEKFTLADCFHPDVAAKFTACPDNVTPGSTFNGTSWAINVPEEISTGEMK